LKLYHLFRPLLFKLDPETAHRLTLQLVQLAGAEPFNTVLRVIYAAPKKPLTAFGLSFKNPIGLAAGYDKDGIAIRGLSALGFGHIEIGTVTPLPQTGNPKPRLFRLIEDEAIVNRMGFPSKGAAFVQGRLKHLDFKALKHAGVILGINLGKNKATSNEEAVFDYLALLQNFAPYADYLAINVSSPNTVGLRELQGREMLAGLLTQLNHQRKIEQKKLGRSLPLLVKLAPDLGDGELEDAVGVSLDTGMDGVIVTNTTLAREGLRSTYREETGGLSGRPLAMRSDAVLTAVVKKVAGRIPVIGVGGVMNPEDARRKLDLGATLIQVYSGLVYAGPGLIKQIVRNL
jgi:dihydroorotate dehydrogenase